jgi:thioredoxin reductase (NADPH)
MEKFDVVIIGAGPGGMTAGIYAVRANLKTLMLEKGAPGGKMLSTYEVENYLGLGNISGFDISDKMFQHTQELGVEYRYGDVTKVRDMGTHKEVEVGDGTVYEAKSVIIASGTNPRSLGIKGESKLTGRGISFCAVCDGAFFKGKDVIVVGGGNSAIEEAVFLTTMVNHVTVVNILDTLQADPIAIDEANATGKIDYRLGYEVLSFNGDPTLTSVSIKNTKDGKEEELTVDGAFIFIGHVPETSLTDGLEITDKWGYIETDKYMETSLPGIFAIGDVIVKELRQIITASSDGAIAAQAASKYIEKNRK